MATQDGILRLRRRSQRLGRDAGGRFCWQVTTIPVAIPGDQTAILLCDVWDKHWSRGATERLEAMVPRMNEVVKTVRAKGVRIIHAPSGTMDFYSGTPARIRMADAPYAQPPDAAEHSDPPLPIDDTDGGSDTGEEPWHKAWSRQHPAIEVDQQADGITDSGQEVYNWLQNQSVTHLIVMGVHTNMCILNRSFAIKQMVRWGVDTTLVRDLTDSMYNPARPPYVSHEEGTRLVIEYVEKFWCPTIHSQDLL